MLPTVSALFRLIRPVNLIITFFSILAATVIAGARLEQIGTIIVAGCVGVLVAAGANAINDYFDVEIDRVNRPDRPLPSGSLTTDDALVVWGLTGASAILLSSLAGKASLAIATGAVALLYVYSRYLKTRPLVGNIVVGFMTGMAFIYGGVVVGTIRYALMPAIFALLVNVAREVIKDIEDREGDARAGAATVPLKFGLRSAKIITTIALVVLVASTAYAYLIGLYNETYLWIVMPTDLLLSYVTLSVWRSDEPQLMHRLSTSLKVAMILGLAAVYLGR